MTDLETIQTLVSKGANVDTAILTVVVFNAVKVHRMERTVTELVSRCADCPRRKKNPIIMAMVMGATLIIGTLLSGCGTSGIGIDLHLTLPGTNAPAGLMTNSVTIVQ